MSSRELYKNETGKEPIYYNGINDNFTDEYLNWLEQRAVLTNPTISKEYFIIRKYNCCTTADTTDILGLTTDEEYAKSRQSVFCNYEKVKLIK